MSVPGASSYSLSFTGSHERTGGQGGGDQVSTGEGREPPTGEPSCQIDHRGTVH